MDDQAIPHSLLSEPCAGKMKAFESSTIAHPLLVQAKEKLQAAIRDSASNSLVLVVGPTGVGKTTLLRRIEQVLTEELLPELET
jgi:putative ribosome biogenesis GTPase RsgA